MKCCVDGCDKEAIFGIAGLSFCEEHSQKEMKALHERLKMRSRKEMVDEILAAYGEHRTVGLIGYTLNQMLEALLDIRALLERIDIRDSLRK